MTLATWYAYGDGWSNTPFEMTDGEFWIYLLCPILFQVVVLYTKANHVRGKGWHALYEAAESEGNDLTVNPEMYIGRYSRLSHTPYSIDRVVQ